MFEEFQKWCKEHLIELLLIGAVGGLLVVCVFATLLASASLTQQTIPSEVPEVIQVTRIVTSVPTVTPEPTPTPRYTRTPKSTSTSKSTEVPAPPRTPMPTDTPISVPEPMVLTGSGDSVVEVDKWDGPGLAHISYVGASNFVVWNYDGDNECIDLLVNTIGSYEGTVPLDFVNEAGTARFQVTAAGQWKIAVLPLSEVRRDYIPGTLKGVGDDVVAFLGTAEPDVLIVDAGQARSNFVIWSYGLHSGRDLVVNEIAPYSGTVMVARDTFLLVIGAEGSWTIEVN